MVVLKHLLGKGNLGKHTVPKNIFQLIDCVKITSNFLSSESHLVL